MTLHKNTTFFPPPFFLFYNVKMVPLSFTHQHVLEVCPRQYTQRSLALADCCIAFPGLCEGCFRFYPGSSAAMRAVVCVPCAHLS